MKVEIYLRRAPSIVTAESALVGRDFDQVLWESVKNPLTMLGNFTHYMQEHCIPRGVGVPRVAYTARNMVTFFPLDTEVEKMKRADFRLYEASRMAQGVTGSTVRREFAFVKASFNHNRKEERIATVPYIQSPPQGGPRTRFLTAEEVARVMRQYMPYRIRMFFRLAFLTAARAQAIEQLTWTRVDFVNGLIDFRVPGVDHKKKRRAIVPIPDELRPYLEAAYLRPNRDELVIGRGCCTYHPCKAVMIAAGINEVGVARHVARKTWASHALQHGHPIAKVAAFLADKATTVEKHYAFILPEHLREVANFKRAA